MVATLEKIKKLRVNNGATEQFNGREGETATLFSRLLVNSKLRGGGFAPRHLSRSAFRGEFNTPKLFRQFMVKTTPAAFIG